MGFVFRARSFEEQRGRLLAMSFEAAAMNRAVEDYLWLDGERIFVRVEPRLVESTLDTGVLLQIRGFIVLAEGPPPFGSRSSHGRKWRAAEG